jgi:WD40 repeat protein
LLTANSKEIRLWKIKHRQPKRVDSAARIFKRGHGLVIPKAKDVGEAQYSAKREYTYKNSSESNIHSLSLNIDQQNFLSSDDKGVYLWNLENANRPTQFTLIKK